MRVFILCCISWLACLSLVGCRSGPWLVPDERVSLERFSYAQIHMGAKARIVLYAPDEPSAREAAQAAFARIAELNTVLSDYQQDSEINRVCAHQPDEWVPVSDDLLRVLTRAQEFAEVTQGAFDCTVGPLSQVWRDARKSGNLPDPDTLASVRARVGWNLIALDPVAKRVRLARSGMRVDFGGIGKGYAADQALATLGGFGIDRALVDMGGDIAIGAPPPGEDAWRVTIQTGYGEGLGPVVRVTHAGVATSGDTEQYVLVDGERYSHILDPRTGVGLTTRTAATVVAPNATSADALASSVCVLGTEGALEIWEQSPDLGVRMMVDGVESRFGMRADVIGPQPSTD